MIDVLYFTYLTCLFEKCSVFRGSFVAFYWRDVTRKKSKKKCYVEGLRQVNISTFSVGPFVLNNVRIENQV